MRGVYAIQCKATGTVYVGSSTNIENRWATHFKHLREKRHSNYKLQMDYDLYGKSGFRLKLLEIVAGDRDKIYAAEQKWLDRTPHCYNILKDTREHLTKKKKRYGTQSKFRKR
jgi:group I intron endonuclease